MPLPLIGRGVFQLIKNGAVIDSSSPGARKNETSVPRTTRFPQQPGPGATTLNATRDARICETLRLPTGCFLRTLPRSIIRVAWADWVSPSEGQASRATDGTRPAGCNCRRRLKA